MTATALKLVVHKSRYWLAHRNGRVAFESGCEMPRANPYRRGSPSWAAFNHSFDDAALRYIAFGASLTPAQTPQRG